MAVGAVRAGETSVWRNRALFALMLGHFANDMGLGLLPLLFPLFVDRFGLDLKTVGLITLAYSGLSSLVQPAFGYVADRWGTRWTGLTLLATTAAFAAMGFAPSFPAVVAFAGLAGLGSGAFHPLAAVSARTVSAARVRNAAMSFFITGGYAGVGLGPLLGVATIAWLGTGATAIVLPGAWFAAALLLTELRRAGSPATSGPGTGRRVARASLVGVLAAIGVSMAQSLTVVGVNSFTPTWYRTLGYEPAFYGALMTVILGAMAVGTFAAGPLADRFGRRRVILGSLALLVPALLLFAQFTGPAAFIIGPLVGLLSAAQAPLLIVLTQSLMAGRAGVASGFILGLGFVTTAFGVPAFGAIADAIGLQDAMRLQAAAAVVTLGLACFLPEPEAEGAT